MSPKLPFSPTIGYKMVRTRGGSGSEGRDYGDLQSGVANEVVEETPVEEAAVSVEEALPVAEEVNGETAGTAGELSMLELRKMVTELYQVISLQAKESKILKPRSTCPPLLPRRG